MLTARVLTKAPKAQRKAETPTHSPSHAHIVPYNKPISDIQPTCLLLQVAESRLME